MTDDQKLDFTMVNPTLEGLIALTKHLTGKDPTPEAIERCKAKLAAALAELPRK